MEEKKVKTRIFWDPFEVSDYVSRERWLEERAEKGWKLVGYTGKFPKFEKTAPFQARYRLDYHHDRNMDDEQVALYEAAGWEFVDTLGEQFFIFLTTDPQAEELHTDPEMQAYALRKLKRSHIINMAVYALMICFYAYLLIHNLTKQQIPVTELVRTGPWPILYILAVFGFLSYVQISQAVRFIKIWKQLRSGETEPKEKSYRKAVLSDGLGWIVALVACFSWVIVDAMDPRVTINTLSAYTEPLPFLQLHEIENGENFEYDSFVYKGKDWNNYMEYSSSAFAPEIITAKQHGFYGSGIEENRRYLMTEYFIIKNEKLADKVLAELMDQLEDDFPCQWKTLSLPGTKEAYYCITGEATAEDIDDILSSAGDLLFRNDGYQFLFLRVGNQVMKVCYHGTQNLLDFADEYVSILQAQ